MKNKLLLIMLLGLFLIGNVMALECIGDPIKTNQVKTISQVCADATYITISSIQPPEGSPINLVVNMTSIGGGEFQYNFTNTSLDGRYDVRGISDGCENTFATCFDVTPSGFLGTLGFYIILLILSLGLIILGYAVEDYWIIVFGSFGLVLFGLFVFLYGIVGIKDSSYTYGFAIISIMFGAYLGIRASVESVSEDN